MTTRLANYVLLVGLFLAGCYYLFQSYVIVSSSPEAGLGPVQFPIALGLMLLVLCAVEFVQIIRRNDAEIEERIKIPNAGKLALTVLLTGLYFLVWRSYGYFYPLTAVFFLLLVVFYRSGNSVRSVAIASVTAVLFSLGLYLVFGVAFGLRLG